MKRTALVRRKPMRARSKKRARLMVARSAFVADFLEVHPWCQVRLDGCRGRSVDVHEVIRRSHGSAIVPGQAGKRETPYVAICRDCHDYLTTHPDFAKANNWEQR